MLVRHRSSRIAAACAGLASLTLAASATCKHPKCSVDVDQASTSVVPVIVHYSSDPGDDEVGAVGKLGLVYNRMHLIHSIAVQLSPAQLESLASRPGVAYVSLDRAIEARQTVAPIGTSPEFTAEPINAAYAWSKKLSGKGIGIAIIDSGITPTADLARKVTASSPAPSAPSTAVSAAVAALASKPKAGGSVVSALTGPALGHIAPVAAVGQAVSGLLGATAGTSSAAAGPAAELYTGPNRIVYSYNFTTTDPTDTLDSYGHGTHVAGLIAGNGSNSTGSQFSRTFLGIAPDADLINLRVLDANGQGSDSTVIAAIEAAILLKDTYNIKVINLSLGRPIYESYTQDPLCQAVEQAWKAGIIVVAAAGNDGRDLALNPEGYGTIEAPGNDPYVITVGAANTMNTPGLGDDVMASYSSKGPTFIDDISKPDLIAPGNLVTSILSPGSNLQAENPAFFTPQGWYMKNGSSASSTSYFPLSGTSMATAIVSGAVADLVQSAGHLTPDQIKALLMFTANKNVIPGTNIVTDASTGATYVAHNDVFTQGAGYLDLQAALNSAPAASNISAGYAASPIAVFDPASGKVALVADATALWGRSTNAAAASMLSAAGVYGQNAFSTSGDTALWGRSALWSASDPNSFAALWGSTALWGRSTEEAATALWGRSDDWGSSTDGGTGSTNGATALWGRNTAAGATALWGRSSTSGSTALWGRDTTTASTSLSGSATTSGSTALWGKTSSDTY